MLNSVERLIVRTITILAAIDVVLIVSRRISIDLWGYALAIGCGLGLLFLGQIYRRYRSHLLASDALCCSGLFVLFSVAGSIFNYMFLPIIFAPVDPILIKLDSMLGYSWPAVVEFAALHPWIGYTLFGVYATSLPQLMLLICWHGFSGQHEKLHHFLLTGLFGAMLSMSFWILFPSFGAKAHNELPTWVTHSIPLAVDPAYGRELLRLATEGVTYLSPKNVLGLIAFPSFHIVMACMSLVFAAKHPVARLILYALNILMFPAVLVQGGHFLVDVAGGVVVFLLSWLIARAVLARLAPVHATSTSLQPV